MVGSGSKPVKRRVFTTYDEIVKEFSEPLGWTIRPRPHRTVLDMRRVRAGIAYTKDGVPLKYSYHIVFTVWKSDLERLSQLYKPVENFFNSLMCKAVEHVVKMYTLKGLKRGGEYPDALGRTAWLFQYLLERRNLRYPKWFTIGLRFEEGDP